MIFGSKDRQRVEAAIRRRLVEGEQVFVVCPLIDESLDETFKNVKSAKAQYEKIKEYFKQFNVELLHGKTKASEKEAIITRFRENNTQILVTTPVIEVGIDIPNATIMLIETADRFGLASLHQLRGRVGRGDKKSFCLLFTKSASVATKQRLAAMESNKSGFELAELDLQMRGPGEVLGTQQHGFSELKIASWQDSALIKKTREAADYLFANEKNFKSTINEIVPKQEN